MKKSLPFGLHTALILSLLLLAPNFIQCSNTGKNKKAQLFAKTLQSMSQGALLGSQLIPLAQFHEAPFNPNPHLGEILYERYCDACHGTGQAPPLVGTYKASPESASDIAIIRHGSNQMPAFRNVLTHYQILDILHYLESVHPDNTQDQEP